MKKLSNDENIKNLEKRKILRYLIIFLGIVTIVLAILSIFINYNFVYGSLVSFIVTTILTKKRESIPIKLNENLEIKKIEQAIKKHKR